MKTSAPRGRQAEGHDDGRSRRRGNRGPGNRAVSRAVTLALAVGFAVVGMAGAASAHQGNIKVSSAVCVDADTMTATYTVVWENGTDSGVLSQKPGLLNSTSPWKVVKNITGRAGSTTFQITHEKSSFTDANAVNGPWQSARIVFSDNYTIEYDTRVEGFDWSTCLTPIDVPAKPEVTDPCGPDNAAYLPQTDTAQVDWTLNSNGSLTVKPKPGYVFKGASQSVTYPAPTDSNVACPTPPVTPPVVTPPVVTPPEVLPAEVRVVKAAATSIDKCGRASDLYKVAKRAGVIYTVKGKVVRQGVWIKAKARSLTIRATAADASYALDGKRTWKLSFATKPCAPAPQVAPNTGA